MNTRHLIAYALIAAIIIVPLALYFFGESRRERIQHDKEYGRHRRGLFGMWRR